MVVVRRRNVKMFTFIFLLITGTSFLLNYTHQVTTTTWDPRHLVVQFSEHIQKLFKYPRRPCSCRTCISELGRSLWFDQRFNSTMQPFLTSHNALIPEDSYRWWLRTFAVVADGVKQIQKAHGRLWVSEKEQPQVYP